MQVQFSYLHIYSLLEETQIDQETSSAWAGSCQDASVISEGGVYILTIPLDGCYTLLQQSNGTVTASNTIYGNPNALVRNGMIRFGSLLQLPVHCSYLDTYEISTTTTIGENNDHIASDEEDPGLVAEFQIEPFLDGAFEQAINASNPIIIGEPIFFRIFPSHPLPTNLPFVVKHCYAQLGSK